MKNLKGVEEEECVVGYSFDRGKRMESLKEKLRLMTIARRTTSFSGKALT